MQKITSVKYVPEIGDRVQLGPSFGKIASIGQHCCNCPPFANVCFPENSRDIVECPDLEDLKWNETLNCWEINQDYWDNQGCIREDEE